MKHAYLIIAHNNRRILEILLSMLDDIRNDIYLHVDACSNLLDDLNVSLKHSHLYVLRNRIKVYWGTVSQIKTEYALFKSAYSNGPYSYYHLLSGVDLPIKSQDYIHHFMNDEKREFIGYAQGKHADDDCTSKVQKIYLLTKFVRAGNPIFNKVVYRINIMLSNVLYYIGLKQNIGGGKKKGPNWVSVTQQCMAYILDKEKEVLSEYKWSLCGDEIFIQSLVWNNPVLRSRLYCVSNEMKGCLRAIDWNRGAPYTWQIEDYGMLIHSDKLFARKFDEQHIDVAEKIRDTFIRR